jgi:hypothetical protein
MPEGLQVVPELSPYASPRVSQQDCPPVLRSGPAGLIAGINAEIRDLEREIAFLDALCRPYEQCSLAD